LNVADRLILAGRQTNIKSWLSLFDLYVQPSRLEADPLAVKEAMAMARPVVGTSTGGMPELLAGGRAGVLVPPRRSRELAAEILALAADPARAQALGEAGRAYVVRRYDFRDYEQHLWDLYAPLLGASAEELQPAVASRVLAYK